VAGGRGGGSTHGARRGKTAGRRRPHRVISPASDPILRPIWLPRSSCTDFSPFA
jgi:hypothetical protein